MPSKKSTKKSTKKPKAPKETKVKKPKAPKKEKTVKVPKEPKAPKAPKEPKVPENRILLDDPKGINFGFEYVGEKSGVYIKRMLETNSLTTQEIIEAVQKQYPGSKVSQADVGFYRSKLKKDGVITQVVRVDKDGQRYTLGV